jgi:hypothetical protein
VDQIQAADEQIGYSDEEKILVVEKLPGVPGNHENGTGHDNAENLDQAVEKKVAVQAGARPTKYLLGITAWFFIIVLD